ncbi:uncharacterized protein [Haliotis asinina]|uniref:uncharacterized protein n=1 Tax=Haliotis asinina TaxID=109174 RepID=UPI00353197C8
MTHVGCCGKATALVKAATFLILFAFILVILGFGTPLWSTRDGQSEGLWQRCTGGECVSISSDPLGDQDWFIRVQAGATFGLFTTLIDVILAFIIMLDAACSGKRAMRVAVIVFAFIPAGFLLADCLLYWIRGRLYFTIFHLGFSWGITLTAVFVLAIAGILFAVDTDRTIPVDPKADECECE